MALIVNDMAELVHANTYDDNHLNGSACGTKCETQAIKNKNDMNADVIGSQ